MNKALKIFVFATAYGISAPLVAAVQISQTVTMWKNANDLLEKMAEEAAETAPKPHADIEL